MNIPSNLNFTESHEWIKIEKDVVTVGISDHAQHELGDIVFVDVPDADTDCTAKESFGTIESVKAVSEIYAPVSGTIIEKNEELADHPELVNSDPYGKGWLVKIKPAKPVNAKDFLDSVKYKKLIEAGE